MSGTSLDGVDGVLTRIEDHQWETLGHAHAPLPATLRASLLSLNSSGPDELHQAALASQALAVVYAQVVKQLCELCDVLPDEITAIGAHGQTVRHRPELGYTIQINQPALLAELTGMDVIADFRSRDVAAGGQGAPLVPAFHHSLFARPDRTVVVVNIGGMSNISILRPEAPPQGFDCGPGNALLDAWCELHTGQPFDVNGEWGAAGEVHEDWLQDALREPFFNLPPPKSTGRDLFNREWLSNWLASHGQTDGPQADPQLARDVQATLCELSARAIALAITDHASDATDVVVCGGGALNADLMRRLSEHLTSMRVAPSDTWGMDVMQVEAAAFAWLAWAHVTRQAGNVPEVTGARGPRVLGALYPAR
ncbi:MAG: anhydro-N-acetylmuramic acid kinase [Burkholderiales bacterium]|nr:anhydro-N-acetylmuramic acid kinase [Burkholderiales bacterium]